MDISFIIVNYKSEDFLQKSLLSLKNNSHEISLEVIIINNNEADLLIPNDFGLQNLRIINRATNDGFGKACNVGAKIATGDICFFLNPDATFEDVNFKQLLEILENTALGIVAPLLIVPSGAIQPWSFGDTVSLLNIMKNNFGLTKVSFSSTKTTPREVAWVSGAAFAIKKSLFEKISGFDENFFMYFEDVDLCKRVSALGKKIIVLPNMRVLHIGGQSAATSKKQKQQYYASQDYYFKKHRGLLELFLLKQFRMFALFFGK